MSIGIFPLDGLNLLIRLNIVLIGKLLQVCTETRLDRSTRVEPFLPRFLKFCKKNQQQKLIK